MNINMAICDDNKEDLRVLQSSVEAYAKIHHASLTSDTFSSANDLINSNKLYDCYILDVVLDHDYSGIEITKQIKATNTVAKIIIVSSEIMYAKDAVNIHADYYILKPFDQKEIHNALDSVFSLFLESSITVYDLNNIKRIIPLTKIVTIETYNRITQVFFNDDSHIIVKQKISDWQDILNGEIFVRCYRGLIINIKQIKLITDNEIIMKNGKALYASRRSIEAVKTAFYNYLDRVTI